MNNNYTEKFVVTSRVKQGGPLSPILFIILIDVVINKMEIRAIYKPE
jgi:hypothetical protein